MYCDTDADPAEMLDAERFPHHLALVNHLLDGFIPAIYARLPFKAEREREREMWSFTWSMKSFAGTSYGSPGWYTRLVTSFFRLLRRRSGDLERGVSFGILKRSAGRYRMHNRHLRERLACLGVIWWSWPMSLRRARTLELCFDIASTHLMLGAPEAAESLYESILHATRYRKGLFVRYHVQRFYANHLNGCGEYNSAIEILEVARFEQLKKRGFWSHRTQALVYALAAVLANAERFREAAAELCKYVSKDEPQRVGLETDLQDLLRRIETDMQAKEAETNGMFQGAPDSSATNSTDSSSAKAIS